MKNKIFIVFKTSINYIDCWYEELNTRVLFVTQDESVAQEYILKYNEKIKVGNGDVIEEDYPDKLTYKDFEIMDKNSSLPVLEKEWEV